MQKIFVLKGRWRDLHPIRIQMVSTVLSGRTGGLTHYQPRCSWLISIVPFGTKNAASTSIGCMGFQALLPHCGNIEHPIPAKVGKHRTPNIWEAGTFDVRRWMLDVGCWMFDVRCSMFDVFLPIAILHPPSSILAFLVPSIPVVPARIAGAGGEHAKGDRPAWIAPMVLETDVLMMPMRKTALQRQRNALHVPFVADAANLQPVIFMKDVNRAVFAEPVAAFLGEQFGRQRSCREQFRIKIEFLAHLPLAFENPHIRALRTIMRDDTGQDAFAGEAWKFLRVTIPIKKVMDALRGGNINEHHLALVLEHGECVFAIAFAIKDAAWPGTFD